MAPWAAETLPRFLRPAALAATATPGSAERRTPPPSWQPADLLPDPSRPATFPAALAALRASAAQLPDDLVVCLCLACVSDAALPLQLPAMLEAAAAAAAAAGAADASPSPGSGAATAGAWAAFVRGWSAEAKRHGDALRGWLYLSGRADARALERSTQALLGAGAALTPAAAGAAAEDEEKGRPPGARASSSSSSSSSSPTRADYYATLMYAAYHLRCGGVAAANAARLAAYHMGEDEEAEVEEEEEELGGAGERGSSGGGSGSGSGSGWGHDTTRAPAEAASSLERARASAAAALPRLLSAVAADKARHEAAFSAAAAEALRRDPHGALRALSSALAGGALLRAPAAALGCDASGSVVEGGSSNRPPPPSSSSSSSSLFLDASAAADALGVLTLRDRAAALDALCAQWGVAAAGAAAAAQAAERGDEEAAREARARAAFALAHGARLRALADLQTERRLRDRRRGAAQRAAPFAWVFGRECGLS